MAKKGNTGRNIGNSNKLEDVLKSINSTLLNMNEAFAKQANSNNSLQQDILDNIRAQAPPELTDEEKAEEAEKEAAKKRKELQDEKLNNFTKIIGAVNGAVSAVTNIVKMWAQYNIEITQKTLNAANEIMQSEFKNIGSGINKSFGNALGIFNKSANELSYSATDNMLDQFKSMQMFQMQKSMIQQRQNVEISSAHNKAMLDTATTAGDAIAGVANVTGHTGQMIGAAVEGINGMTKTVGGAAVDIRNANLSLSLEQRKMFNEIVEQYMEMISEQVKMVTNMAKENEKIIEKTDKSGTEILRTFGYNGNQIGIVKNRMYETQTQMSKLGKTLEDYVQIQNSYIATSNRAVSINDNEALAISANALNFGISDSESAAMVAGMNIFNQTIENSVDQFDEMRKLANKVGISSNKFAKDLSKNLDLAQKYNFKGGVDNMMKMSIWADKVRLNMNSLASSMDGMIDGGIEGALKKAAELQVLGGNTGMFSDPLAMQYEALQDPESYAKRIESMTKDMGRFDRETGETKFNTFEELKLRQMGKTLGISAVELKNMIREGRKGDNINPMLKGKGFSEEEMMGISSRATYDKKSGRWMVNTIDNEKIDVRNLNRNNLDKLLPKEKEEQALSYAQKTMSIADQQLSVQLEMASSLANLTHDETLKQMIERAKITGEFGKENMDKLAETSIMTSKANTENLGTQFMQAISSIDTGLYTQYLEAVKTSLPEIVKAQKDMISSMRTGFKNILEGETIELSRVQDVYINQTGDQRGIKAASAKKQQMNEDSKTRGISGGSNVTQEVQVNDGVIVHTDPQDTVLAAKPGGPFDKIFDGMLKKMDKLDEAVKVKNKMNIDISGKIELTSGGKSVDITPELSRTITKVVIEEINRNNNGGKGQLFPNRYAGVDK